MLASSCSTLLAPGIATTLGWLITHASATCAGVASCALATARTASIERLRAVEVLGEEQRIVEPRRALGRVRRRVAARQQPHAERAVRDHEPVVRLRVGHELGVGLAGDEAVLHLVRQHRRAERVLGGAPPREREVADADVGDDTRALEAAHAFHLLRDRHDRDSASGSGRGRSRRCRAAPALLRPWLSTQPAVGATGSTFVATNASLRRSPSALPTMRSELPRP